MPIASRNSPEPSDPTAERPAIGRGPTRWRAPNVAAETRSQQETDDRVPGVHRVASLAKRWLLSPHQGAVDAEHLGDYPGEFCFRFNRRASRSRGLMFLRVLQLAIGHNPVRYRQLIRRPRADLTALGSGIVRDR